MNRKFTLFAFAALSLCFACLSCSHTRVAGQRKNSGPPPPSTRGPLKVVGRATASYSARINSTEGYVVLDLIKGSAQNNKESLSMMATFRVPGAEVVKPEFVTLGFDSSSPTRKFTDNRMLKVLCDGKECFSGDTTIMHVEDSASGANETLKSPKIPFDQYVRIVDALKIVIHLGPTIVELKESELEGLRDLRRLLN